MNEERKTHTNSFTQEQVETLRKNPYVKSVSKSTIRFTEEFKQLFYDEHVGGKTARQIFKDIGIEPLILGESRIDGFTYTVNKQAKRDSGFADGRADNCRKSGEKNKDDTPEARIRQLEHELAYTRQEVEFLKKLYTADTEARKQWESAHRQK